MVRKNVYGWLFSGGLLVTILADTVKGREEIREVRERILGLEDQIGQKANLRVAMGNLFMREGELGSARALIAYARFCLEQLGEPGKAMELARAARSLLLMVSGDRAALTQALALNGQGEFAGEARRILAELR